MKSVTFLLIAILILIGCSSNNHSNEELISHTNECGCNLTEEEMINELPILAVGDSIKICKVGTNHVIGSGHGPMIWLDYLQSKYHGSEGRIYNCTTNEYFEPLYRWRKLSYSDKGLTIDYRFYMEVYDTINGRWLDLELETYRQRIYAINDSILSSGTELIFHPPYQSQEAFDSAIDQYQQELKKKDHYLISRTLKRLFVSAINGDSTSTEKFLKLPVEFKAYYEKHPESLEYYNSYHKLYTDYNDYIAKGGIKKYYDLKKFMYFQSPETYK